ncbi:HupE/UreJ family protein [Gottfriedia solisilvae]|uniref:HupE/UreJ family protein n=1 Tax=Gottfriedia solisilvae TaxID=1516104 RepID=UPI003D2EEC59
MLHFFGNLKKVILRKKSNNLILRLIPIALLLFIALPPNASAHNYSASFTNIKFEKEQTEMTFTIDSISLIELIDGIDPNNNFKLEKSELKKEEHHLEEIVSEKLSLDKNNEEQTPTVEKMKKIKKEDVEYIEFTVLFPAFAPGDTISLNDGFYTGDSGTTNYVNLLTATYGSETSQAALQGTSRTWTILLTEAQQDQQSTDGQAQDTKQVTDSKSDEDTSSWLSFFKLGMLHILTGYDHLLFLFALLLSRQSLKQFIGTITAFTIAHSITLTLAVFGIVDLPSKFVESVIALSICYVAIENIFKEKINYRWAITFIFGLIHGMGFASILKEMELPKSNLAVALLNFNLGIEFIQLCIALLIVPILLKLQALTKYQKYVKIGSFFIFILGLIWLVQRLM